MHQPDDAIGNLREWPVKSAVALLRDGLTNGSGNAAAYG
jgi:hypothetical protein